MPVPWKAFLAVTYQHGESSALAEASTSPAGTGLSYGSILAWALPVGVAAHEAHSPASASTGLTGTKPFRAVVVKMGHLHRIWYKISTGVMQEKLIFLILKDNSNKKLTSLYF